MKMKKWMLAPVALTVLSPAAWAQFATGYVMHMNRLIRFDLSTGAVTDIGTPSIGSGQAFYTLARANGRLLAFAFDGYSAQHDLWDVTSLPGTHIGTANIPLAPIGITPFALTYAGGWLYYGVDYFDESNEHWNLYRIDPNTAASTPNGEMLPQHGVFAADSAGNGFAVNSSSLLTVSFATGATSVVAPFNVPGVMTGAAFSPEDTFFVVEYYTGKLYSVNTQTGAATFVSQIGGSPGLGEGFRGLAIEAGQVVNPNSVTVSPGIVLSGALQDLFSSNDRYYVLRPGIVLSSSQSPIVVTLNAVAPGNTPTNLSVTVEGHADQSNIRQTIEVYNFNSSAYETLNQSTLATSDSALTLSITNAAAHVGPNNELRMRLSYRAAGPTLAYPWRVFMDEAVWRYQ